MPHARLQEGPASALCGIACRGSITHAKLTCQSYHDIVIRLHKLIATGRQVCGHQVYDCSRLCCARFSGWNRLRNGDRSRERFGATWARCSFGDAAVPNRARFDSAPILGNRVGVVPRFIRINTHQGLSASLQTNISRCAAIPTCPSWPGSAVARMSLGAHPPESFIWWLFPTSDMFRCDFKDIVIRYLQRG